MKLNEKLWSKQLIVTDIKQEEKAAPHAVKVKDHPIRWPIKIYRSFDPSLVTFHRHRSWSDRGEIQYYKFRVQRTISKRTEKNISKLYMSVKPWLSQYFQNGRFLFDYEYLNGLMHWSLRTKFPVLISPRIALFTIISSIRSFYRYDLFCNSIRSFFNSLRTIIKSFEDLSISNPKTSIFWSQ